MKRDTTILISATLVLIFLLGGLYFFIIRPRMAPIDIGPLTNITPKPTSELPDTRHSVLNLYFYTPLPLSGIARIELTLIGIEATTENGKSYSVFEGSRRITVQEHIVQKIASERIFHGRMKTLTLFFGPTARVTSTDRSIQTVFLPQRALATGIDENIPTGRTLNTLVPLPESTIFGEENGVLTLELPTSTEATHAMLGGFHLDERSIGEIFTIENATIRDAIYADIGLDITPRKGPRGTSGFRPAPENAPKLSE